MSFHYKAELDNPPQSKPSAELALADWFPLTKLPEQSEVAHHGWALTTIRELVTRRA